MPERFIRFLLKTKIRLGTAKSTIPRNVHQLKFSITYFHFKLRIIKITQLPTELRVFYNEQLERLLTNTDYTEIHSNSIKNADTVPSSRIYNSW
jgi:hypothetical protein